MTPQTLVAVGELAIGFLSLPILTTGSTWIVHRLSREHRLISKVERLARVYAGLPESDAKADFGNRLTSELHALNHELDPLLRLERRRKRTVVIGAVAFMTIASGVATAGHVPPQPFALIVGLSIGACMEVAFWAIGRSTVQRRRL
jgi:hypothetical protein